MQDPTQRNFAGDNFVRKTGDYQACFLNECKDQSWHVVLYLFFFCYYYSYSFSLFHADLCVSLHCVMTCHAQGWEALNLHSWKAYDKGQDIHLQGVPSQVKSNAASSRISAPPPPPVGRLALIPTQPPGCSG